MPPVIFPNEPSTVVVAFERRHTHPEASALLLWAFSAAGTLHYLVDLDAEYESNRVVPGDYPPDLVDVAHARWATSTCITALDLGAAGLARVLGNHVGARELDLGDLTAIKPGKSVASVVRAMDPRAFGWIRAVADDPAFVRMKAARDALTHRRLPRHFFASFGSDAPDRRLDLQVGAQRLPVRELIENARDLATRHLTSLLSLLPTL